MSRQRATTPDDRKHKVVSVRLDSDGLIKLARVQQKLGKRIGVKAVNTAAALEYCVTTVDAED